MGKIILCVGFLFITVFFLTSLKNNKKEQKSPVPADSALIKKHLTALTKTPPEL